MTEMNAYMRKFGFKMAALALCLSMLASLLASCELLEEPIFNINISNGIEATRDVATEDTVWLSETTVPDTEFPETSIPQTSALETEATATDAPETTRVPETTVPETTIAPETTDAPETTEDLRDKIISVENHKLSDGSVYTGDLRNGIPHGKGKIVYKSGDTYEGDFVDGVCHGKGKYIWKADGSVYEGDWLNGERTGKGVFTWSLGDKYEGDFVNAKLHGKGTYTWSNGSQYTGDWVNGDRTGSGTFIWSDKKTTYTGQFLNDKLHGRGLLMYANGSRSYGIWENDKLIVCENYCNAPDDVRNSAFLRDMDIGRCGVLEGDVTVTVILTDDKVSAWDDTAVAKLKNELAVEEKFIEDWANKYGVELDITFSYIEVSIELEETPRDKEDLWIDAVYAAAGFESMNTAQKELDESNDADANPIMIALNKQGRAHAYPQTYDDATEMFVLFENDNGQMSHELFHIFSAADLYYPEEAKQMAIKYLPESIMNGGRVVDPLTAYLIGWDDELDAEAYNFLKETMHITEEHIAEALEKQNFTGYVENYPLSGGRIYTGYLEKCIPEGEGRLEYTESGNVYEGFFVYGRLHGEGKITFGSESESESYEGMFDHGKYHGHGVYTWKSGAVYDGEWFEGKRHGEGNYTYPDGSSFSGVWENGKFIG